MRSSELQAVPRHGRRLFQVVGVPRSGTSLLAGMLDGHLRVMCLNEPFLGWIEHGYIEYRKGQAIISTSKKPSRLLAQLLADNEVEAVGFKETFRLAQHHSLPTDAFVQANAEGKGTDATIVIVRDPRDTWVSVLTRFECSKNTPLDGLFTDTWNACAQWAKKDGKFVLRYEDLVADPMAWAGKIAAHLGLAFDPAMLIPQRNSTSGDSRMLKEGRVLSGSAGRWHTELLEDARRFIEARCGVLMRQWGYEL